MRRARAALERRAKEGSWSREQLEAADLRLIERARAAEQGGDLPQLLLPQREQPPVVVVIVFIVYLLLLLFLMMMVVVMMSLGSRSYMNKHVYLTT